MLRVVFLTALVALVVADDHDPFNEIDKDDINKFKECTDLSKFDDRLLGYWKGRTQMTNVTFLKEYDIHYIKEDGTGFLNGVNEQDIDKITRVTPTHMWCKLHGNMVDRSIKLQYGPTQYGQLICLNAEMGTHPETGEVAMLVSVNQVLFADARLPRKEPVALNCLNYIYQSKFNSYTVWADQIYAPSNVYWTRTPKPGPDSDWCGDDCEKKNLLKTLLKALTN